MSEPILLLPQLKPDADVKSGDRPGEWNVQASKAFVNVATSLSYESPGAVKNISSVPTMWARPLTMEMVLYDDQNSLREQIIPQWQGMLAAIALAEIRGFPITAQLLELGELRDEENFAKCLHQLLPDYKGRNLYTLENKHPWEDIYLFLWDKQPIGMTSPTTIVVPAEKGHWQDLPWWDNNEKILKSPKNFLNAKEQALLWRWLDNLNNTLTKYKKEANKEKGDETAIDTMRGLLTDYQRSLTQIEEQKLILSDDLVFFEVNINRGVLEALNRPLKAPERPSCVELVASKPGTDKLPLLIYDPEMARVWNEKPQNIWIHGGKTLASLKPEEFSQLKGQWTNDVQLVTPDELFFPELKFIELENALPGALSPEVDQPLVFQNQRITPLIPLNPLLLDYFTPEGLLSKIKFQKLKTGVRLILDLPLSGVKEDKKSENYRLSKDYDLKVENSLGDQLPVLQVWPNFQKEDWREYYTFYYDGELQDQTFKITYPQARKHHGFKEGFGSFLMYRSEKFPEYLPCTDFDNNQIGLILFPSPTEIRDNKSWHIGVDFGTSFTNIYVNANRQEVPQPLKLNNLQFQVTKTSLENRLNTLFEYFVPENFRLVTDSQALPLSSVLTIRGKDPSNTQQLSPILDGRIYVPDNDRFEPQQDWIKTNLKWDEHIRPYSEVFLKNLALYISALAAQAGVTEIQWSLSYPSAFSRGDILNYSDVWSNVARELEASTGIKQNYPEADLKTGKGDFRTESLAIAQYFADFEDKDLVYTTCIDIGGGTSDISIWEKNNLVHQCSVQLAGRDIFSQFIKLNLKFAEEKFGLDPKDWQGLGSGAFSAKLDVWLRYTSEQWLTKNRALQRRDPNFQGLTRLMTIGIAGLYYYVGILLKVLHEELVEDQEGNIVPVYKEGKITPVYIGGNASRFLKWLDERGKFDRNSEINELFSRMLSKGSAFKDTEEVTNVSKNPKDEAACGLVLSSTKLKGLGRKVKDPIIAGEKYLVNGEEFTGNQRLTLGDSDEDIKEFTIPELIEVPKFLYEFHQALRDLELESITALPGYKMSPETDDNSRLWQETQRELNKTLLNLKGESKDIRPESTFILGLKALLTILGKKWADE
ncbi:hypothetical protein Xen7305DRAFT_00003160 [Xenococcus sp. PCC 7305]|uniref:hypothetical protein n=1 Tax=Xenococcus sp. PCC 7305 TaxID=102125 RepID=UPI0002ABB2BD|nr:hypothetical protein [Xenococcus sp. PCC 7305]ELS00615.1 hypothetical protein Xen7305DRAFT_00003160 [Xenococcus sp. PCC 7305]